MEKEEKQNSISGWIFTGGFLVLLTLGIFIWLFKKLPPEIPWLYSLHWGEQQLIGKVWFGASLGVVLMVLGVCAWLAKGLSKEDARASIVLARGGFFLTVIYLLSFFQVLRLMI